MNISPSTCQDLPQRPALSRTKETTVVDSAGRAKVWIRVLPAFTALHFNSKLRPCQCQTVDAGNTSAITSVNRTATSLSLRTARLAASAYLLHPFPAPGGNESENPLYRTATVEVKGNGCHENAWIYRRSVWG